MPKSKCPYKPSKCEFKGKSVCPFPNSFKDDKCVYCVSACDKCSLSGNPYKRFGAPESGVMIVGGSNYDSSADLIEKSLSKIASELNLPIAFYYTTAVKCVTEKKPSLALIKRCNAYLKEELNIIKPKYVLVIGDTAFKALLWDFDLITSRKPEIDSCAGSHIEKDGVIYFPIQDFKSIEKSTSKQEAFEKHLEKFVSLINGRIKITPTHYKEIESEDDLEYILDEAKHTGRMSVDIETDPYTAFLPNSEILTISFTVKEAESFCAPLSFRTGNYFKKWNFQPKVDPIAVIPYIHKLLKDQDIVKIFHHAAFDITWLEHILGCRVNNYEDTMIMKFLMNQSDQDRKGLKPLTKMHLDMGAYEYNIKQYVGDGEPYSNIPPKILINYNNNDTDATLRLWNIFNPKLKELQLEKIYHEFMLPRLRGIIDLQKAGIAVDTGGCIQAKEKYEKKLVTLFSELRTLPQVASFERQTGSEFNPSSPKQQLAMVYGGEITTKEEIPRRIVDGKKAGKKEYKKLYYNGFNLKPITVFAKTVTGEREQRKSFGKKAIQKYLKSIYKGIEYLDPINTFHLESLPDNTDIMKFIKLVSKISSIQTQLSNHIEPFINIWSNTVDKCVHTSYDLTGTTTGRLASRNPNLQNLKREGFVKTVLVSRWGDEGILLEADYKQLELFILAILSNDPKLFYAFTNGIDVHKEVASEIAFRVPLEKVTKLMRTASKPVNFGIVYGLSKYSLAEEINVSVEEADRIINDYYRRYSGVYRYKQNVMTEARNKGYVTTVIGRRRYLDYSVDPNGADRQAVNTTIQSPASDVCITAVTQLQEYYNEVTEKLQKNITQVTQKYKEEVAIVSGTVHDSIIIDCKKKHVNEILPATKYIMENTGFSWLTIPLKIDIKYGPNLLDMTEWSGEEIKV